MKGKRVLKKQSAQSNSSLLGTYFSSLFSVLLCVVMLLGTTFAWFYTDSTSVGNEIHSGILKVDMLHVIEGENKKISLTEQEGHQVFSPDHLWTPDSNSQTQTVEIHNTGNVALDYKLDFVRKKDAIFDPQTASLFTVSVWRDGSWDEMGGLDEFLSDMDDDEDDDCLAVWQGQEEGLQPGEFHSVRIKLQMNEVAAHGHMGRSVPVYLKLEAYQHLAGVSG